MNKRILIVTDGKPGHENQSKALCAALGCDYDCARVTYPTRPRKALSYLLDNLGVQVSFPFRIEVPPGRYAAVVCTGSTTFYPGKWVARKRKIAVAAILYPRGYRKREFNCILAPAFDLPANLPNVIRLPVNLTPNNPEFYAKGVKAFQERHAARKAGVGVIIGGSNSVAEMRTASLKRDIDALFSLTKGYERWVTTSRRTSPEVEALVDSYPFDYKLIFSRDHFNPIPAFVTLCERLFVTADSTGMISESVTRGTAAVEVLMNLRERDSKFGRFITSLEAEQALHIFDGSLGAATRKIDLAPLFTRAGRMLFPDE